MTGWVLAPGLTTHRTGDDWFILDAGHSVVMRATGDAAAVLCEVLDGHAVSPHLAEAHLMLSDAGVLVPDAPATTVSRRRVLGAGAAAVGLVALSLPQAAAAASDAQSGITGLPDTGSNILDSFETVDTAETTTTVTLDWSPPE
jgi:hypothetical protein